MFISSATTRPEARRSLGAATLCVALWCCANAAADPAAEAALRTMHDATRTLNYDGVFVYQRGEHLESMRLIHRYADDNESERLISLSGPAREVIRNGAMVTCLSVDENGPLPDQKPPRDIIGKANATINKALADPQVIETFTRQGAEPAGGTPEHLGKTMRDEYDRWKKVIADAKIVAE